ncbi:MAG: ATP-grasp domain-containing protein [Lutibacter sp.]|uniref:ATP-grasp domain-containing protein n=1 Tax=Lutibacter sp. TaxID=1925666 RepID=UPI0017F8D9E1|nr:ATP-grasp domain-containing protein [Lutibacter sp.]MBT8316349.1 ATP-grasp domain-containing protein [Lutibacter sp.]NNJ57209.1 ATP-grasp domain-containing protein [Lutibacter sp.]
MFLIDKPYVSDFLIKTIKENNFQIVKTEVAKELVPDKTLNWISETDAKNSYIANPNQPIYSNSENSISWVEEHLNTTKLPTQIGVFKNKIKFRELLKETYPNYFFKGVKFEDLDELKVAKLKFPFIIKPAVGFFSLGVHKVDEPSEWNEVLAQIKKDINHIKGFYPTEVLDANYFIIEECIEGEEYAVDCYYNEKGEAVILNIMHHIFSSGKDVSDRVYSTSKEIISSNLKTVQNLVTIIGEKANLKNFPIHIEVRIDESGIIIPIEVNPMRFGGWCTTGDMAWYAYGINSYEHFLYGKKPNWDEIFKNKAGEKYSLILLDNTSGIPQENIKLFDYDLLLNDFEKPLLLRKVAMKEYPVFGFVFTETSEGNEEELKQILTSNLRKYIISK